MGLGLGADCIGTVVKIQGKFSEALGACTHVLTHLPHLRGRADLPRSALDFAPVFAGQARNNTLDNNQMLHHVLLLVPSHHGLKGHGSSGIEICQRLCSLAGRGLVRCELRRPGCWRRNRGAMGVLMFACRAQQAEG